MRCVVLGMRNAVRCEIWCYGDIYAFPWGAGHETLRWTRASEQAGKALRSQGHQCAHVM